MMMVKSIICRRLWLTVVPLVLLCCACTAIGPPTVVRDRFVKTLSGGLLGSDQSYAFKPALLVSEGNQREFVYVIEDHGNGDLTILKPWAPTAFSGSVKIVPKEQVQSMDISLAEATMVLNHPGMGAQELIGASNRIRK